MKWEADHPISRVQAEALGISQEEQDRSVVAAHASCNHKHGAKLGNAHRAKPRTEQRKITPVKREINFSDEASRVPGVPPHFFSPEGTE
jgi:hypothetical protein